MNQPSVHGMAQWEITWYGSQTHLNILKLGEFWHDHFWGVWNLQTYCWYTTMSNTCAQSLKDGACAPRPRDFNGSSPLSKIVPKSPWNAGSLPLPDFFTAFHTKFFYIFNGYGYGFTDDFSIFKHGHVPAIWKFAFPKKIRFDGDVRGLRCLWHGSSMAPAIAGPQHFFNIWGFRDPA